MSTLTAAPPTLRFQEKREAILNAAATQFNEHGLKGATLSGIAASVGLVTNSVTYYYRKKEDLAAACFLRAIAALSRLADNAMARTSVEARLHEFFRLLALLMTAIAVNEHPPLVMFNDLRALPCPLFNSVSAAYADLFRKLRLMLVGPETTGLTRSDFNARAYGVLSLTHWLRTWIHRHEVREYEYVAQRVTNLLVHGIQAEHVKWDEPTAEELRWQLHPGGDPTREAFMRAASELINLQSYRGVSVEQISQQLKVTKGSFYHHNDNKEDVAWACFERSHNVINRALDLADHNFGSAWQRACAAARSLARFQLGPQGPLLRLATIAHVTDPQRRELALQYMNRLNLRQAGLISDGLMDRTVRPLDPNLAAYIGTGLISSTSVLHHWVRSATEDNIAALYVQPMMSGLLCASSGVV